LLAFLDASVPAMRVEGHGGGGGTGGRVDGRGVIAWLDVSHRGGGARRITLHNQIFILDSTDLRNCAVL
jgi:hypothetical protein